MNRKIDTMNADALETFLDNVAATRASRDMSDAEVRQELERLFAEEPQWFDNLDPDDNQTWVLCFVSDDSPEETWLSAWVINVFEDGYAVPQRRLHRWKYATPVDLNVRFKKGEE